MLLLLSTTFGVDDVMFVLQQNRLRWYHHVLQKKTIIGWKNVWSMKWRVPNQEVDQRRLGERLCKNTVKYVNWTGCRRGKLL